MCMGLKLSSSQRSTEEVKTPAGALTERHRAKELPYSVLSFPSLKLRF